MKHLRIFAVMTVALALLSCKKDPTPAKEDTLTLTPSSVTIPAEGGTARVAVETTAESVTCTVPEGASWLTATVSGSEITFEAPANPEKQERSATVTVKGGTAEKTIAVTQSKGSKKTGYTDIASTQAYYSGITLLKLAGLTEFEGGALTLTLESEDGRYQIALDCYTECFEAPEDVKLTPGTYTKGTDDATKMKFVGKKLTWVPGKVVVLTDEDGEEELQYGSFMNTVIGEETAVSQIADGTFTVAEKDGKYTITTDLKTEAGEDVKFYYEGPVEIDATGASYPGVVANPTDVIAVEAGYMGDSDKGATHVTITLACAGGFPMSVFSIYIDHTEPEDLPAKDLSGTYSSEVAPGTAGSADLGAMMDIGDFSFPMGSYIVFSLMDYFTPDELVSLTLVKKEDGKYVVTGTMKNSSGEEYNFMDDRTSFEIVFPEDEGDE